MNTKFFTVFGYIFAILWLLFGISQIAMGVLAVEALNSDGREYFSGLTPGEMIDRGMYKIPMAIALGILAEISWVVRR